MRHRLEFLGLVLFACGGSPLQTQSPRPVAPAPEASGRVATDVAALDAGPPHPPVRPRDVSDQTRRLARLAVLWGRVRYLDPTLFEHRVDWDAALARAIPAVMEARDEDQEATAVAQMLGELHDPVTRLETLGQQPAPTAPGTSSRVVRGTLVVRLARDFAPDTQAGKKLIEEAWHANALLFDLRASRGEAGEVSRALNAFAGAIVTGSVAAPAKWWIQHEGFVAQRGEPGGGYRTTFASEMPRAFKGWPGEHPKRVAFLMNRWSGAPELALALQRDKGALVVAEGPIGDPAEDDGMFFPYGAHHGALVRATESNEEWRADVALKTAGDESVEAALRAFDRPHRVIPPAKPPPALMLDLDEVYATEKCPPLEHRLLGLFRFFTAIDFFYPYKALLDQPWSDVLDEFIPKFIAATTPRAYELAVREASTRVQDSHVWVKGGEELFDWQGHGRLPFSLRRVEGRPVVTAVAKEAVGAAPGVTVGDVLVGIGGQTFEERRAVFEPYVAGSTPEGRANTVDWHALRCVPGATVTLRVTGEHGETKEVSVPCLHDFKPEPTGPVVKTMGDIGYVDLGRLEQRDVDAAFVQLEGARGIVFDMRGYPHNTAWEVAAHLKTEPNPVPLALTSTMLVSPFSWFEPTHIDSRQQVFFDPSAKKFTGKTVMIIDDRAISASEHTGLFLEAANKTTFIGSSTAGANGYTTWVCLPGNLCITFSGSGVRHGDGRQLQRVGLQPDIPVEPTIAGVRAGKDEVLERAITYLHVGR